jgi:hypothetical protein
MLFVIHISKRVVRPLLFGAMLLGLVSCGHDGRNEVYPVKGKVLFQGNSAEGATVTFHPAEGDSPKASLPGAQVRKDGEFQLSTFRSYDGAPAGRYVVTIVYPSSDRRENDENIGPDLLRGRYANPKTSPLRIEILKQDNKLEPFELH